VSKFNGVKTNNAKISAKKDLRNEIIRCAEISNVIEVYCGKGEMFDLVWNKSDSYIGIDKVKFFDKRNTICGDAVSCLKQIDVTKYNIFDIDAYGSPYECISEIVRQLEASKNNDKLYFCVTDGLQIDMRMGRVSKFMAELSGVNSRRISKAHKMHNIIIKNIIHNISNRLNRRLLSSNIAIGKTGSGMRYYTFILSEID